MTELDDLLAACAAVAKDSHAARRFPVVSTAATIERVPHVPRRLYVMDCSCGWQSPLCASQADAAKAHAAHQLAATSRFPQYPQGARRPR